MSHSNLKPISRARKPDCLAQVGMRIGSHCSAEEMPTLNSIARATPTQNANRIHPLKLAIPPRIESVSTSRGTSKREGRGLRGRCDVSNSMDSYRENSIGRARTKLRKRLTVSILPLVWPGLVVIIRRQNTCMERQW